MPGQHRLLTVSVHLVRLHSIKGQRVADDGGSGRCHKVFIPLDGWLGLTILDTILGKAMALSHDVHLAFLEMLLTVATIRLSSKE